MENLKELNLYELKITAGGYKPAWYEILAFMAGDMAGRGLDFAHGFWDGINGVEKH